MIVSVYRHYLSGLYVEFEVRCAGCSNGTSKYSQDELLSKGMAWPVILPGQQCNECIYTQTEKYLTSH